MNRLMTIAFLRIYAYNLGRKWRNSPKVACSDAIVVMSLLTAIPMSMIVVSAVALTGEAHLDQFLSSKVMLYVVGFAGALPLLYWLTKTFSRFAETPELASPYMAPRARFLSFLGVILTILIFMAGAGYLGYLSR